MCESSFLVTLNLHMHNFNPQGSSQQTLGDNNKSNDNKL